MKHSVAGKPEEQTGTRGYQFVLRAYLLRNVSYSFLNRSFFIVLLYCVRKRFVL